MSTRPRRRRRRTSRAIAPRRRSYRRLGRLRGFFRRRRPKPALIPMVTFGAATLAGTSGGWSSPIEGLMGGHMEIAAQSFIRNLTGMQVGMRNTGYTQGFNWNIMDTLNPFNMNEAVGLKGLIWGSIADMVLGAIGIKKKAQPMLDKIPFVKRFSL